jgi:hypothetical protein
VINLPAEKDPVSNPVSPPRKRPPAVKKKYAATSPSVEGFARAVISGSFSATTSVSYNVS